jgi:Family of unknown function (DUF6719)
MFWRIVSLAALLYAVALATPVAAQTLRNEPPMGGLKRGQRVLVDDGSCPKGQIKEVIGGDHIKAGGTKNIQRTRRCIPKR